MALMFVRNSLREAGRSEEGGRVTRARPRHAARHLRRRLRGDRERHQVRRRRRHVQLRRNDRWRYRGGVGKVDANLDFYGAGGDLGTGERSIGFTLDGWASSQQLLLRLGESNSFVAAALDLPRPQGDVRSRAGRSRSLSPAPRSLARARESGPSLEHDSRDNIFTPARGWIGSLDTLFYAPAIGGDRRFQTYRAHVFAYDAAGAGVRPRHAARRAAPRAATCPSTSCRSSTSAACRRDATRTTTSASPSSSCAGTRRRAGRWSAFSAPARPGARRALRRRGDSIVAERRGRALSHRAPAGHLHGRRRRSGPRAGLPFYIQVGSAGGNADAGDRCAGGRFSLPVVAQAQAPGGQPPRSVRRGSSSRCSKSNPELRHLAGRDGAGYLHYFDTRSRGRRYSR